MNYKINSIKEKMKLQNLQGMIITDPLNIRYLIGIPVEGTILLTDKENLFITDTRYIEEVNQHLTINDDFVVANAKDISDTDNQTYFSDCPNVGFEENYVTYASYKNMVRKYRIQNMEETENLVEKERMIKTSEEIENIRKACEITDNCFTYLLTYIKPGLTEKQIALAIEKFFLDNGADGLAFDSVVASGANSSKPHAIPTEKIIRDGDPITIDFGAKYKGYVADMTRTIFVGNISENLKRVYELVLKNQNETTKEMKVGTSCKNLSRNVESNFYLYNYTLVHALGHGVGLNVHEMPYITHNSQFTLKENMVVTNEPGIYIPEKFGVRIEDTILITAEGAEVLTKSSKEICII